MTPHQPVTATRRTLLAGAAAVSAALATPGLAGAPHTRVRPGSPAWPSDADWAALKSAVGGRLEPVVLPKVSAAQAQVDFANQFWLRDQPAYTQVSGWIDAWRSAPSAYVVKAQNAADVSAAVRFARDRRLRLVVRGAATAIWAARARLIPC